MSSKNTEIVSCGTCNFVNITHSLHFMQFSLPLTTGKHHSEAFDLSSRENSFCCKGNPSSMWCIRDFAINIICYNIFTITFTLTSSPPSATYLRQWIGWALAQIMTCRIFGSKHYLNQCWIIVNWTLRNKLHWNFDQNTKQFIHENVSENIVCEMATILARGTWVNIHNSTNCTSHIKNYIVIGVTRYEGQGQVIP